MNIVINWKDLQKRIINWQEVTKVIRNGVQIRPESVPPVQEDYFCLTSTEASSYVILAKTSSHVTSVQIEISYDKETWTDYTYWNTINLPNIWDKVYFRNKSETPTTFSAGTTRYFNFQWAWKFEGSGDLNYLLCKTSTTQLRSNYCFYRLFQNLHLQTAPKLPATTLTNYCYQDMFDNTYLTVAPELPATTLTDSCYYWMFTRCTNLTTAPSLPATTAVKNCYTAMFGLCSSLNTLPEIKATTLWDYSCSEMFYGCSNIKLSTTQDSTYTTPYRIPTTGTWTVGSNSLVDMFYNTWWTFAGTPTVNTTYYTSNTII